MQKVLIIGHSFQETGIGITLQNLFSKFPKDTLYCASSTFSKNDAVFKEFYLLGNKEIKISFPFNLFEKVHNSCILNKTNNVSEINKSKKTSFKRNLYMGFVRPIITFLKIYNYRSSFVVSNELMQWIRSIQPDIIYSALGSLSITQFIQGIHEKYPQAKLAIHMMDDWLSTQSEQTLFSTHYQKQLHQSFNALIHKSSIRIAISEKMAEEYKNQYGFSFSVFHNPVNVDQYLQLSKDLGEEKIKKIVYIGKINKDNYDVINDIILAVNQINSAKDRLSFHVYTPANPIYLKQHLKKSSSLIVHLPISHNKIPSVLANGDLLILPLSFREKSKKYTRFSISTKLTEYMASKTPILVYAPKDIALSEYVIKHKVAVCLTKRNIDLLSTYIDALLTDDAKIKEITENAFRIVSEKHSLQVVSSSFFYLFNQQVNE